MSPVSHAILMSLNTMIVAVNVLLLTMNSRKEKDLSAPTKK